MEAYLLAGSSVLTVAQGGNEAVFVLNYQMESPGCPLLAFRQFYF